MTAFFSGYLALGTGSSSFAEMTGTGYGRAAITMDTLNLPENITNTAPALFVSGGSWSSATQYGLYDASSSGNLVAWWAKLDPVTLTSGMAHVVNASALSMILQVPNGMYPANTTIGTMQKSRVPVFSGNVTLLAGVLAAFTFGPTGPTGVTGPTGASVTGPTGATGATPAGAVLYGTAGAIPTSDPHIVGHIWSSSGTITISAG